MAGAFLLFEDLPLKFEAVTSEKTDHMAKVTDHAVESGGDVSDNVRNEPDAITLEVFVSNAPIVDVNGTYGLEPAFIELFEIARKNPVIQGVKLDVKKFSPSPVTPGAAMQALKGLVSDLFAEDTVAQVYGITEESRISGSAQVQSWPTKFNAVTDVVGQLVKWKEAGEIGKVILPWRSFDSMVITGVSVMRDAPKGDGAVVSITLRAIRLVESKLVTAPVPTEARGATAKAKGRQALSTVREPAEKKKSLLKKLAGLVDP